jgi:iron complex transport system substrate-binding protein
MRLAATPVAIVAAALLLAACGDSDSDADGASNSGAGGAITVTDDLDRKVELDAPATRVVALEWEAVENVLALGVDPVGVGDGDIYRDWVAAGKAIPEGTESVGTRTEPSVEKVASLEPDLIVAGTTAAETNLEQFEKIAPVVVFDIAPKPGDDATEWERMEAEVDRLGTLLGKEDEADELLADMEASLEEQAARIAEAGVQGDRVALVQAYTDGKPSARLFDDGALLVEVLRRIGLENAYAGEPQQWGITTVGLEGLRQVADADWLLTLTLAEDDPFLDTWSKNPAYQAFPVAKADRIVPVGGDTWTWGGPLSVSLAAERFADAVTGETKPY